ncbi:MAG: hypothetical protein JW789_04580 [Candidatus Aenigmarchaeota archaeon]|nr:hypothetical protein [Candidatus Aenigmarchaeota archaeon]
MNYSGSFNFEGEAYRRSDDHSGVRGSGNLYSNDKDIAINLSHSVPDAAQWAAGHASDMVRSIRLSKEAHR